MDVNGSKEINNKIMEVVIFRHKLTFHNNFVKRWMKVHDEKVAFESSCIAWQKMKRSFPKVDDVELPDHIGDRHELTCDICVRLCFWRRHGNILKNKNNDNKIYVSCLPTGRSFKIWSDLMSCTCSRHNLKWYLVMVI